MKTSILALAAAAALVAGARHAHDHERRRAHLDFHPRHQLQEPVCGCTTTTWYGEATRE